MANANLHEDKSCYITHDQRLILLDLLKEPIIGSNFFLTGGTALSVFYIHHRCSNDLDLCTEAEVNLSELGFWIRKTWPGEASFIKEDRHFLSFIIRETKVDFVFDFQPSKKKRIVYTFENGRRLTVDTISEIGSNKLCTCVSRTEPKDYIDFYFVMNNFKELRLEDIYIMAQSKDAVFDDPPTAAYQIEEGIKFLRKNPLLLPKLKVVFDLDDFIRFFRQLTKWIYNQVKL